MHVFRAGLLLSFVVGVGVTWAAWNAGDLVEIALVRGLLGMIAVAFLGYVGELVVLTAPGDLAAESELDVRRRVAGRRGASQAEAEAAISAVINGARMDAGAADSGSEAEAGESRQAA
jgi:hypothetical protein